MTNAQATVRLPYAEHGDPDGIPVVMLHGISDTWRSFEPVFEHLPAGIHAYALTLRGHGEAPRPVGGYDVEQLAADVVAFMDDAAIERAIVVGHSMGTIVATRLAIDARERVAGLVLAGGRPTFRTPDLAELYEDVEAFGDTLDPDWVRAFQESTISRPVADGLIETATQESLKMPPWVWQALIEPTMRADHSGRLGSITAPTLVICGELDEIAPPAQQQGFLDAIVGARLVVHEGGGHAVHWEDPAAFARDVAGFAAELRTLRTPLSAR
jgi:pimeloyl-ACP methyl ester carboxylesterase